MSCTTILVGKDASYDGSTMIARNDDSGAGHFTPKKMVVLPAREGDTEYTSVLSHVKVSLPYKAYRCTIMPNAVKGKGLWGACGVNEKEVGMTATETITSNPRVLGADPLVEYQPADDTHPEVPGGIGEEDLVILTLPYINSAREGVQRLGALLEKYGTYEMNGIAFSDKDEIWWLETIGGHHWMARRVPDDSYVVMPNQQGIDEFDFEDALGEQADFMCSSDLLEFVERYHLDLTQYFNDELELEEDDEDPDNTAGDVIDFRRGFDDDSDTDSEDDESDQALSEFDPRAAFGSHDDADHVYNTPRAWFMLRYFNPTDFVWDGPDADYKPESDDLPWCLVPEKKITPEDVKYVLSSHFQGTPYDPYKSYGDKSPPLYAGGQPCHRVGGICIQCLQRDDPAVSAGGPLPGLSVKHDRQGLHRQFLLDLPPDRRTLRCRFQEKPESYRAIPAPCSVKGKPDHQYNRRRAACSRRSGNDPERPGESECGCRRARQQSCFGHAHAGTR